MVQTGGSEPTVHVSKTIVKGWVIEFSIKGVFKKGWVENKKSGLQTPLPPMSIDS